MTIFDFLFGIACLVGAILMVLLVYRRWPVSAAKAADWPEVEGTIQSVNKVMVGRGSHVIDVADFSYAVGNEFNSGRVTVSPGFSTADNSAKELVN